MADLRLRDSTRVRAARLIAVMLGVALGTLSLLFSVQSLTPPLVYSKDFGQEYLLARAIRAGVDPYLPVRVLAERFTAPIGFMDKEHPTPHPPTLGVLLLPLAFLSYPAAAAVWFAFQLGCIVAAVYLIARSVDLPLKRATAPLVALILLAWPAMLLDVGLGQLMAPMLAGFAGAQLAIARSRFRLGGGLLGLTLLVKPIAWPLLMVLGLYAHWRAAAVAIAVAVIGYSLSGAIIGFDRLLHYVLAVLPELSASMALEPTNISLWVVGPRVSGTQHPLIGGLVPLLAVAALVGWIVRYRPPLLAALAVATALCAVLSPIAWQFYIVVAALPMGYAVRQVAHRGFRRADLVMTLVVAGLLGISYGQWLSLRSAMQVDFVLLGPTLGLVLLAMLIARISSSDRRPAS